mgnify:CR=1 FL=1
METTATPLPPVVQPDEKSLAEIRDSIRALAARAMKTYVTDPATNQEAADLTGTLKGGDKKIVEIFKGPKSGADKIHDWFCDLEKSERKTGLKAIAFLDNQSKEYDLADRKRLAEELNRKRIEEEARLKRERAAALEAAAERGDEEAFAALDAAPLPQPVIVAPADPPKVEGRIAVTKIRFRIVFPAKVRHELCSPDDAKIAAVVKAFGMATQEPGVEVYEDIEYRSAR